MAGATTLGSKGITPRPTREGTMSDTLAPAALASVADRAAGTGGAHLRERFRAGDFEAEYTATDVTTDADVGAEERILATIREIYPDHAIAAEESGVHPGDGGYRWVVDPLDGTNNFAIGIPTFAVGVTAIERTPGPGPDEPVATAVHVPVVQDAYVATRDSGVSYNGRTVTVADGDAVPLSHATIASVIGGPVLADATLGDRHAAISDAVGASCKRLIQSWAPLVNWGLLARGRVDGFVCFHPDEREQAAGALLAREAGCVERGEGPLSVYGVTEAIADAVWERARAAV
jgi:myo-inositol-1(or 4)-monophosphatase